MRQHPTFPLLLAIGAVTLFIAAIMMHFFTKTIGPAVAFLFMLAAFLMGVVACIAMIFDRR